MKCEDIEEDNDKSEILPLSIAVSNLDPSSFPIIKEEIKNEPDCHGTQLNLESPIEFELNYIIKPETNSNALASDVCEESGLKEELCLEESSIDDSENNKMGFRQNFTNVIHKNIVMGGHIMDTT